MPSAADTLFLPILSGDVTEPSEPWLFLGARAPGNGFPDGLLKHLVCEQPMRGPFLDLQMRGADVCTSVLADDTFAGALVLIGRHRGENEAMVARAASLCRQGSTILIAGDKTNGIGSLRKRIAKVAEIEGSQAKYHATVFWIQSVPAIGENTARKAASKPAGFQTAPGMFSAEKIDSGSSLLAEFIDESINGAVADFGAGWGYLSHAIAKNGAARSLDLFEAHWPSLEAARHNLIGFDDLPMEYHWFDITREPISTRYDCIVMNPPFHADRKTEPALGEKFIEVASNALKPKGRLLMVANSGLPYERKISAHFSRFNELEKRDGFKILLAEK